MNMKTIQLGGGNRLTALVSRSTAPLKARGNIKARPVRVTLAGLLVLSCFLCAVVTPAPVAADSGMDFSSHRIDPGEYLVVPIELSLGEGLYTRFRVTYGPGIYFFIVDQDGYDDIMGGSEAETGHREATCLAEDGIWRYVDFIAPHNSTWYVWFSKVYGAPLADSSATIEGHVRKDMDGPIILEALIPQGNVSGTIEVPYRVRDLGFPISWVRLCVNGTPVDTDTNPETVHDTTGFEVSGVLTWDSTTVFNGNCTLTVEAADSLGHNGTSNDAPLTVNNGYWDYLINRVLVIGGIILIAIIIYVWRKM